MKFLLFQKKMKTKILLKNIQIYGTHGVNKEEITDGQFFEIDVEITSLNKNINNDDLSNVVDYSNIYQTVIDEFNKKRFNLIEILAYNISDKIIKKYKVLSCKIRIRKPNVPINGKLDYVEVEIENFG